MPSTYAVPVDAQKTIIDLLRPIVVAKQAGAHVGAKVPDPRPPYLVTVRLDGGPMVDQVQTVARLGVNTWGPDEPSTIALCAAIESGLLGLVDGRSVLGMRSISGPMPVGEAKAAQTHIYMTFEAVLAGSIS